MTKKELKQLIKESYLEIQNKKVLKEEIDVNEFESFLKSEYDIVKFNVDGKKLFGIYLDKDMELSSMFIKQIEDKFGKIQHWKFSQKFAKLQIQFV